MTEIKKDVEHTQELVLELLKEGPRTVREIIQELADGRQKATVRGAVRVLIEKHQVVLDPKDIQTVKIAVE